MTPRASSGDMAWAKTRPSPISEAEVLKPRVAKIPLGRMGQADEVAQAIVFLVQNDFVTGTMYLPVDVPVEFEVTSSLASSLAVVLTKNLFHSVLYLALSLTATAGIFLALDAEFLAAVQLLASRAAAEPDQHGWPPQHHQRRPHRDGAFLDQLLAARNTEVDGRLQAITATME